MKKYITLVLCLFILFSCNRVNNNETIDNTGSTLENSGDTIDSDSGNILENSGSNIENNTSNQEDGDDSPTGFTVAQEGNISLVYPTDFFDAGHEPTFFSGACDANNLENITKIVSDLKNFSTGAIETSNKNINGKDFLILKTQDSAMSHTYINYYYSNFSNNKCFVIGLETSKTNCENYLPLEAGNNEQKSNYDACVSKNKNFDKTISDMESTLKIQD